MEQQSSLSRFLKRHWLLLVVMVVGLIILAILNSYSVIHINASGINSAEELEYALVNQKTKKALEGTFSGELTKIVPRGSYEVTVRQADKTSFSVASTKGFFRTTDIEAKISPSLAREFVGDGPRGCFYRSGQVSYSFDCSGSNEIVTHLPASSSQPTSTVTQSDLGVIRGVVQTKEGVVALTQPPTGGEGSSEDYSLQLLGYRAAPIRSRVLPDLDTSQQYFIAPYRDGFLIYNSDFSDAKYFPSVSSSAQKISIPKPDDDKLKPLLLNASGDIIMAAYSDKADYQSNSDPKGVGKVKSQVILFSRGSTTKLDFSRQFAALEICGSQKLCAVDSETRQLLVYDINENGKLLFKVEDVEAMAVNKQGVLVSRTNQVVRISPETGNGNIVYQSDQYSLCGLQAGLENDFLVCVADGDNQKTSLLLISAEAPNQNSIDSTVAKLGKLPAIQSISAYGKLVFISPNLGDVVYSEAIDGFDYDPAVKNSTRQAINQALSQYDLEGYSVTVNGL